MNALEIAAPVPRDEMLAVNAALDLLDEREPIAARLVKLHYVRSVLQSSLLGNGADGRVVQMSIYRTVK